jgi:DNA (cytosine-5)-methyltransferase 1
MNERYGEPRDTPIEEPAPVITEKARTATWADPRVFQPGGHHTPGAQSENAVRVTVLEASTLQSFPPDFPWQGSRTAQFRQIGNAVPPLLARAILAALLESERR